LKGPADVRPIRVLLADDHAMVRQGMAEMLSTDGQIEVVGEAANGREAVDLARSTKPDVVVLDVEMPLMGGQAALRRLLDLSPPPRVVVVTVFADQRLVRELLGLGASAYLTKNAPMRSLISTVRSVAQGEDDNVIVSLPRETLREDAGPRPEDVLSRREAEVLGRAARGENNREIALTLHLSETTVKRHLSNAYEKMGVHSRGEATRKALSEGWLSTGDITRED
jgi:DNA-binding NarL/FixJ family response regulator